MATSFCTAKAAIAISLAAANQVSVAAIAAAALSDRDLENGEKEVSRWKLTFSEKE